MPNSNCMSPKLHNWIAAVAIFLGLAALAAIAAAAVFGIHVLKVVGSAPW